MLPDYIVMERFSRVAPLGIRFFDVVTRAPFRGALTVQAYSTTNPSRRFNLFPNPSNIYVLQNVPGLRDFEIGEGDNTFWATLPALKPYIIEVSDPGRNFLPFQFEVDVPTKGIFQWECPAVTSPPASPPQPGESDVPIYSSVSRPIPEGMANLRVDLYDPKNKKPAAWAVVETFLGAVLVARGIADANGRVNLMFTYPEPVDLLPESPLGLGLPLSAQRWELDLRVAYAPEASVPQRFDLCATLSQLDQPAAQLWETWGSTPAALIPLSSITLRYGEVLVARSHESVANGSKLLSVLYVTPAV